VRCEGILGSRTTRHRRGLVSSGNSYKSGSTGGHTSRILHISQQQRQLNTACTVAARSLTSVTPLADFEHGAVVALRHKGHYLSCKDDPHKSHGTGVALTTRNWCADWEHFRLHKNADGTISLQNMGGGFISPTKNVPGSSWGHQPHKPPGG
jgi:hypothetical protein